MAMKKENNFDVGLRISVGCVPDVCVSRRCMIPFICKILGLWHR